MDNTMNKTIQRMACALLYSPAGRLISDEPYLKLLWLVRMGSRLNLQQPQTFNEKLQWLKLHDRNPNHKMMVDKNLVKPFVSKMIGKQYVVPTLGCFDNPRDICLSSLPNQFVAKCTHDSGSVFICRDKTELDFNELCSHFEKKLSQSTYWKLREWPYKDLKPRIIIEPFLSELGRGDLVDYKVLCFDGEPKAIEIHQGRKTEHTQNIVDTEWRDLGITQPSAPSSDTIPEKPNCLKEMLSLSSCLAAREPHVRVDWYIIEGELRFGELTFYDGSGFSSFDSLKDDILLGSWINLELAYDNMRGDVL